MNRTFTKMKFEFLICWDLRTNADNYRVINILDDSTVNFECIFPIKINVIIPFTFLSSNMHTDQQNNPIRITLCGFPVLFSQWLSFNLSQKNEIIISAILPDQDSACESDPLDSNVVLLQINSPEQQLESINKLNARSKAVLAWWTGNYLNDDLMIQIVNSGASGILADHHLLEDVEKQYEVSRMKDFI